MSDADTKATQSPSPNRPTDQKQEGFDRGDMDILYNIYIKKRLDYQADFYKNRVRENNSNANFTFLVSTAVMSISALVAAVSAVISSPFFSLLSAILPALAALLAAFRQLYGWERQSSIYQDALMGLERVKLLTPDKDDMPSADLATIYPAIVAGGEEVFTGEVNQWGQFVQNADKGAQDDTTDTRVTNALMGDLKLSDEQIDTIRKIMAAGTPKGTFSQHTITVHPEETSALPSGASNTQSNHPSSTDPLSVTTTRTDTTTFQPDDSVDVAGQSGTAVDAQAFEPATSPIAVTTTHTESTVVEHVIPAVETQSPVEEAVPIMETQAEAVSQQEPVPESMDALTPGAAHVDAPQASEETDALISHQEVTNEPPPPEAMSSLTPGALHVDAPQAPPENPNPEDDPTANG